MTSRDEVLDRFIGGYGFALNDQEYELVKEAWQAATQASESEINSLKQKVEELEAENTIMRDALNKIALGYVLDVDIIESAGDCLQRLSTTKSLAERKEQYEDKLMAQFTDTNQ